MSNIPDIETNAGLTFREKSLWTTLISMVGLYAYYFWRVIESGAGNPVELGALFAKVVVAMIAIQIVVHASLSALRRPERPDERDRQISLVATRASYYVLMSGVWGALGVGAMSFGTFWVAHAALLAVVVGEVARCAVSLVLYRRGHV